MTRLWMIFTQGLIHQHLNLLKFNNKLEYLVLWTKWLSISLNDTEININIFFYFKKDKLKEKQIVAEKMKFLFSSSYFCTFFSSAKKVMCWSVCLSNSLDFLLVFPYWVFQMIVWSVIRINWKKNSDCISFIVSKTNIISLQAEYGQHEYKL